VYTKNCNCCLYCACVNPGSVKLCAYTLYPLLETLCDTVHTAIHCITLQRTATHCNISVPNASSSASHVTLKQRHKRNRLVLMCVEVCCSVWQYARTVATLAGQNNKVPSGHRNQCRDTLVVVCCSVLQACTTVAVFCSIFQCATLRCSALQCVAVWRVGTHMRNSWLCNCNKHAPPPTRNPMLVGSIEGKNC